MSKVHITVLGLLNERPMHGYELQQVVRERHLDAWAGVNPNSVYKAIQALQNKGFIDGREETEGNNPPRTVFSIKETGHQELTKLVEYFLDKPPHPPDFWLGVAFGLGVLSKRRMLDFINRHIEEVETRHRRELEQRDAVLEKYPDIPYNWRILIEMGNKLPETMLGCLYKLKRETEECDNPNYFKPEQNDLN